MNQGVPVVGAGEVRIKNEKLISITDHSGHYRPSLYNTYKYRGLPPGPIANPGLSAIMAAIYPTPNQYYYFLTTPDGQVIYNKTFEEHIADKNKYY